MRLSDLSPSAQQQALAQLNAAKKPKTTQHALPGSSPHLCAVCEQRFETFGAWEKHSDSSGHRRSILDLEAT